MNDSASNASNAPRAAEASETSTSEGAGIAATGTRSFGERWAPWATAALLALPTLILRFPPMTDLPMHEALVGMMRHFYDARYFPPGLYEWNIGHPNQMFHLLAAAFSFVVGPTMATKIVVALAQGGIVIAAARLADHLKVSRWTALLVSPLALGWTYLWGLIANMLGFAVFLAALPALDDTNERPTARRIAISCGWMVLLYFAHESVMVIAGGVVALFALGKPIDRKTALRFVPIAFALAIFFGQQAVQRRLIDPDEYGEAGVQPSSFFGNLRGIPSTLTGVNDLLINTALWILVGLALLTFVTGRWQTRVRARPTGFREVIHRYRFELVAIFCGLAYLLTPYGYAGGTMFNHRFYHPAYSILAIALAPQLALRAPSRLERLLCGAVPIGFLLVMAPDMIAADECERELDVLAPKIELGSSIAYIEANPALMEHGWAPTPMAAHVLALRGGRMMFSFTYSVIAPVQIVHKYKWSESINRLLYDTMLFMPQHDLHLFRYVLVHSENPMLQEATERVLPEAHHIATEGAWALYESNLPTIPLESTEPPLPSPEPETLRHRTVELLRKLSAAAAASAPH